MLAAANRLRKSHEIMRVYRRGKYADGGALSVKALKSGQSVSRVAIVVAKKVSKRAVVRNRIRRRLAGALQERWQTVRPGYDIVVTVHRDMAKMPTAELQLALTTALRRADIINPE